MAAAALNMLSLQAVTAMAQHCGDWYRAVVCTAELVATDSRGDTVRHDDGSRIELAPREQIDLRVEARDQRGMRFPADRLALRYDDYDCRSLLSIEDGEEGLLRVAATAAEGRCRLEIWMPNNLNFQWLIDVEISVGVRLYLAEMQRGQYASVLRKLIRSPEFEGLLQR